MLSEKVNGAISRFKDKIDESEDNENSKYIFLTREMDVKEKSEH